VIEDAGAGTSGAAEHVDSSVLNKEKEMDMETDKSDVENKINSTPTSKKRQTSPLKLSPRKQNEIASITPITSEDPVEDVISK